MPSAHARTCHDVPMPSARYPVPDAWCQNITCPCPVPIALCTLPCAHCPLLIALCPLPMPMSCAHALYPCHVPKPCAMYPSPVPCTHVLCPCHVLLPCALCHCHVPLSCSPALCPCYTLCHVATLCLRVRVVDSHGEPHTQRKMYIGHRHRSWKLGMGTGHGA